PEAIFRGEQVGDAILAFYTKSAGNQLPTSMDQLREGLSMPGRTKKIQVLRKSAAVDPLSKSGEWRPVHPTDRTMIDFARKVAAYYGGAVPVPSQNNQLMARLYTMVPAVAGPINIGLPAESGSAPCGDDESAASTGPFIGVGSRNRCASVVNYYGIDRHDFWVFTPIYRY
ncbi:MAG TPA: hypothetical protein VF507_09915, partial [Pyrinomonadaceae bacterium]